MKLATITIVQPVDIDDRHYSKEGARKDERDCLGSLPQVSGWLGDKEDTDFFFDHLLDHPTFSLVGVMGLRFGFRFAGTFPTRNNRIALVFQKELPDA